MKRIILSLTLILLLGAASSCSLSPEPEGNLDGLFQRLRSTRSTEEARIIEISIRRVWVHSGGDAVETLMNEAVHSMQMGDYDEALETVDKVISQVPTFAEGWNLRATVHYLREEYGAAVGDIERVLALEPRHFGALAGLGRIFLELEDKKAAARAFEAALALNPHLDEVERDLVLLREELAGMPI